MKSLVSSKTLDFSISVDAKIDQLHVCLQKETIKKIFSFLSHENCKKISFVDAIRGKVCYETGLHVFEVIWAKEERGTHPVVGVCTGIIVEMPF